MDLVVEIRQNTEEEKNGTFGSCLNEVEDEVSKTKTSEVEHSDTAAQSQTQ